jgi:hypothetical protein
VRYVTSAAGSKDDAVVVADPSDADPSWVNEPL